MGYYYDGTYEGLLCGIKWILEKDSSCTEFCRQQDNLTLFDDEWKLLKGDIEEAKIYANFLRKKLGILPVKMVYYANLSESPKAPGYILDYIRFGLEKGGLATNTFLARKEVWRMLEVEKKISREYHLFLGLIRFSQLESGILYSQIAPDHRILQLLGPHFAKRLPNERWLIHDVKRNWALLSQGGKYELLYLERNQKIAKNSQEDFYQQLWQHYYTHTAILERTNLKLQKSYVPQRYWSNLIEKPGLSKREQEKRKK